MHCLLAFFVAHAHCVCLAVCVCWIHAGLVCEINSCCSCRLPAVVSHLPKRDAECLPSTTSHLYILYCLMSSRTRRDLKREREREKFRVFSTKCPVHFILNRKAVLQLQVMTWELAV